MTKDEEHLRLLAIFHYVVGGIGCFLACLPLLHMMVGLVFIVSPETFQDNGGDAPPAFLGWMFFFLGLFFFLIGQVLSICILISGRFIKKRIRYLFSFVVACLECAFFPFGTVLGVLTIIVLVRDSVKSIYEENRISA